MAVMTLEKYRANQLSRLESWIAKQVSENYTGFCVPSELERTTLTGRNGTCTPALILRVGYDGLYMPEKLGALWARIESYLHRRNIPGLVYERRGSGQALYIYFQ